MPSNADARRAIWSARWQALARGTVAAFVRYANWLVGISWLRFVLLSVLLLALAGILSSLPPFTYRVTETVRPPAGPVPPMLPAPPRDSTAPPGPAPALPAPPGTASGAAAGPAAGSTQRAPRDREGLDISIDERGIRIVPRDGPTTDPAASEPQITVTLPPGVDDETVREAVREARETIREAIREKREAATEAAREVAREAGHADPDRPRTRTVRVNSALGEMLPELALLWILGSMIIKITYKGRIQAEEKAAQATETAEAEQLRRQVVEARMAAMQAQVEPHFLFNTLASIDHLIETDPPRASQMQKNLIALLRASMPSLREASGNGSTGGVRELGRELAVIRPYLEILKVRMEERLSTRIDVPDGLLSAEFPPMMVQTLVENAIQHGLEPKAEGGALVVKAEVRHGKLAVSVADTGLGFGKAGTAGTGVGLGNIRERLRMLYGTRAALTIEENPGGGTIVTVTVPYRTLAGEGSAA